MRKKSRLSPRLLAVVEALPLFPGIRVLEIGCGSGAAAREASRRIGHGQIVAIDRSDKVIQQALAGSEEELASGRLVFRKAAIETFTLAPGEMPFDMAFAIRVGALDGRHPEAGKKAAVQLRLALKPGAKVFIDGGSTLTEFPLNPDK